ncbi:TIGR02611 family protein [Allosaccharopolyspora coralli]|uniref:TIGR02611 family protein n=1 Tax=Allosaccharopolyspora coralli TaxID=2665642 RepID=A0A5Q3QDK9_9PSEU|nr:TIGR02611 family protein [Allosaccharopolyspora coralli]
MRGRLHERRERIRVNSTLNTSYRIALGTLGTIVLLAGLLMVPYPGPGWLVVFAGLGILATEFSWAHNLNTRAKRYYHAWTRWLGRQNVAVKLATMGLTCAVVLTTLWLLGLFAMAGSWVGVEWDWLSSPLFDS